MLQYLWALLGPWVALLANRLPSARERRGISPNMTVAVILIILVTAAVIIFIVATMPGTSTTYP